jgi:penicillin-binding protein 2
VVVEHGGGGGAVAAPLLRDLLLQVQLLDQSRSVAAAPDGAAAPTVTPASAPGGAAPTSAPPTAPAASPAVRPAGLGAAPTPPQSSPF